MKARRNSHVGAGLESAGTGSGSTGPESRVDRTTPAARARAQGVNAGLMSRRQFGSVLGIEAGALACASLAFNTLSTEVAHAAPVARPGSDPHGLLDGASTFVPKGFQGPNSPLGDMHGKVTAIRFHTNTVVGVNRNGSPRYTPSYASGGLVDSPAGVEKTINGVAFIEYTGEISGYVNRSNVANTEIVYGPIDEFGVDHTDEPVASHVRGGLKGICFILKIPRHGWNGVLVDFHTGGWPSSNGIYNNELDEIHLVSEGYAHVSSFASGYESKTDTNHNNDAYWENVVLSNTATTCRVQATRAPSDVYRTNMYTRDFAAVMKNLCGHVTGHPVARTYYMPRSASGNVALSLDTGRSGAVYYGNNYIPAFANCPCLPGGVSNPDYQPDAPMVFDGFLVYSPSTSQTRADLDPRVPISPAPMITMTGETDLPDGHFGGLVLPYYAHRAKAAAGDLADLWPDTNRTFFYHSFEHLPHFHQLTAVYALAKNGGGKYAYIDASGNMSFNNDGRGKELDVNWGRMIETYEFLQRPVPFNESLLGIITYFTYSEASFGGVMHQMLDNLHQCVTRGTMPPASNIDSYFYTKDPKTQAPYKRFPKFPEWPTVPPSPRPNADVIDTTAKMPPNYGATTVVPDIAGLANGLYRTALDYIAERGQDVLRFNRMTWRLPEDAARLGLYRSYGPFLEYVDRAFTEAELLGGVSVLDWNGQPLVTMTLPNGKRIPESGYKNHGAYVSAVAQAVKTLVKERLYDAYLAALHVAAAAQGDYPLTESRNVGEIPGHDSAQPSFISEAGVPEAD